MLLWNIILKIKGSFGEARPPSLALNSLRTLTVRVKQNRNRAGQWLKTSLRWAEVMFICPVDSKKRGRPCTCHLSNWLKRYASGIIRIEKFSSSSKLQIWFCLLYYRWKIQQLLKGLNEEVLASFNYKARSWYFLCPNLKLKSIYLQVWCHEMRVVTFYAEISQCSSAQNHIIFR